MKFTKEAVVEKLNQNLTNGGKKTLRMSMRTLEGQAESLMALIANEEMELDEFVSKVMPMFESVNGNMEHDFSDFTKNFKHDPQKPEPQKTEPSKDIDPTIQAMMEKLAALEKESNDRKAMETVTRKKAEIKKFLKDKKVENDDWMESILGISGVSENDDVETKGNAILELYNKHFAAGPTGSPAIPQPGDKNEAEFGNLKELIKSREQND